MVCLYYLASVLTNTNDILKVDFCHLVSSFTNIDDKAENLAVYCQTCIYKSGSALLIFYPDLKAIQLCRILI